MVDGKYTFISTFAGCGGSSLGYKWAGFKELLAIEWEDNAVKTFKLNFPDIPIWQRDIRAVTSKEIIEFLNIDIGELDLLDGSPPCQGFSTAGKRVVRDERNDLFQDYARLVDELQPKVFVMENVSGMIKGKMKGRFIEIMQVLKSMNYNVKAKLMNAMYYNVPQSRQRMIFIGVRKDINIEPSFPKPNNKVITVIDALKNIKIDDFKVPSGNSLKLLKQCNPGEQFSKYHKRGYMNGFYRVPKNKPCPTITKAGDSGYSCCFHHSENRTLSINEMKALSSFPQDFYLGDFKNAKNRIGNAVTPKFMQAIAENIKINILDKANL